MEKKEKSSFPGLAQEGTVLKTSFAFACCLKTLLKTYRSMHVLDGSARLRNLGMVAYTSDDSCLNRTLTVYMGFCFLLIFCSPQNLRTFQTPSSQEVGNGKSSGWDSSQHTCQK